MEVQKKTRSDLFLERFKQGLLDWYKITFEELIEKYKYCGGDGGNNVNKSRHYNYWVTQFGYEHFPRKEHNCVCGQPIVENCFVTDGANFIHMGNCCIKKFMPENKSRRTCEICEEPHKNRKYNLCNECKITHKRCQTCKEYFEFDNKKHEYCNECYETKRKKELEEIEKKRKERENERKERENERKEIENERKEREKKVQEIRERTIKSKKGFMNAEQTVTKIKQIKQCIECSENYETTNVVEIKCLCNSCKLNNQNLIDAENKRIEEENILIKEENIKKNQRIGLMCYCKLPTVLREVKKDGPNKGKLFYACSKYYAYKCDYFMWKDESCIRINKNAQINSKEKQEQKKQQLEVEENIESIVTRCFCKLPTVLREVKKDGPTKGKMFHTCSKYYNDKCKYFMWHDETI
jgi:hypothetical protein